MADPTDENRVYELPAGVIVAISSGRPTLLEPFVTQVEAGEVKLNKKTQVELLRLVQGLLADLVKLKAEKELADGALEAIRDKAIEMRKDVLRIEMVAVNRNPVDLEDEG